MRCLEQMNPREMSCSCSINQLRQKANLQHVVEPMYMRCLEQMNPQEMSFSCSINQLREKACSRAHVHALSRADESTGNEL